MVNYAIEVPDIIISTEHQKRVYQELGKIFHSDPDLSRIFEQINTDQPALTTASQNTSLLVLATEVFRFVVEHAKTSREQRFLDEHLRIYLDWLHLTDPSVTSEFSLMIERHSAIERYNDLPGPFHPSI